MACFIWSTIGLHVQLNFSASLSGDQAIINEANTDVPPPTCCLTLHVFFCISPSSFIPPFLHFFFLLVCS